MEVNLAKSAGFCFGVKRAIKIALALASGERKACILNEIVHNEDVVRKINRAGIKKIAHLAKGKGKTLLIPAHGAGKNTFSRAKRLGYKIVDATCPMVSEIHKIAKEAEKKKYKIIVFGDKKHDEVIGIIGQLKGKAVVIDELKNLPLKKLKTVKRAAVIVQSTQNLEKALALVKILKKQIKQVIFFNTICKPTRKKQEEIKTLSLKNEAIIVIGSKTSANTKRLYEIAKSLNHRTFWIQSKKEIRPAWFKGAKKVGVTAGASTPQATTKSILEYLKEKASVF